MVHLHHLERLRLQRVCEHLHALGARATAEAFAEVGGRIGGMPAIFAVLTEFERVSPQTLEAVGGHRFPRRPLRVVPR
jgi:hypothetical protein